MLPHRLSAHAAVILCLSGCPGDPDPAETDATDAITGTSTSDASGTSTGTGAPTDTTDATDATDATVPEPTTGPAACQSAPEGCPAVVDWTHSYNGMSDQNDGAYAVAVDGTGRIIVVGYSMNAGGFADGLMLVLSPTGEEVWTKIVPGMPDAENGLFAVDVDDADNIYVSGYEQATLASSISIQAFDAAGGELWTFTEPMLPGNSTINSVVVADGAVFSAGWEAEMYGENRLVARRHALADGVVTWKASTTGDKPHADANSLAWVGSHLVVVGSAWEPNQESQPIVAVFDAGGGLVSATVEDRQGKWFDVTAIGDAGDALLVGQHDLDANKSELVLRRIGPDGAEVWSQIQAPELDYAVGTGVRVGPGEQIVVSGYLNVADQAANIFAGRFDGAAGSLLWTDTYNNPDTNGGEYGARAAFGPGFVVVAGSEETLTQGQDVWVRRYDAG